ncbi:MAG: hypothetical protein PHO00_07435 [bacterium]|nr:hypothetical protein [bacterium]
MVVKRKFRNYFLKPFQYKYALFTIWITVLGMIFTALIVYNVSIDTLIDTIQNDGKLTEQALETLNMNVVKYLIVPVIIVSAFCFLLSILVSHRVAGPIYKMELFLNKIGEGKIPGKIYFRESDVVPEMGEAFNKMIEYLNKVGGEAGKTEEMVKGIIFNDERDRSKIIDELDKIKNSLSSEKQ